ncbi:MAG: enoyl-CoA hydratase/isomerase family protein [Alphaproteobacteria bacterium]
MPLKNPQEATESSELLCEIKDGVAVLTLNRPEVMNALNESLGAALSRTLHTLEFDHAIRCVVITGKGPGFMAGGDVGLFGRSLAMETPQRQALFHSFIQAMHPSIVAIRRMPKPVIASINGATAGFGMSLMMACDLALCTKSSFFTMAYAQMGLSPDGGGTFFLPRLVGARKAMELALLSERITSEEALRLGLVNKVVEDESLSLETWKMSDRLARGPTAAYAETKRLIMTSFECELPVQLQKEEIAFAKSTTSHDFCEAASAFLAKRSPNFTGQ